MVATRRRCGDVTADIHLGEHVRPQLNFHDGAFELCDGPAASVVAVLAMMRVNSMTRPMSSTVSDCELRYTPTYLDASMCWKSWRVGLLRWGGSGEQSEGSAQLGLVGVEVGDLAELIQDLVQQREVAGANYCNRINNSGH